MCYMYDFSQLPIKANVYEKCDNLPYIEAESDTLLLSSAMGLTLSPCISVMDKHIPRNNCNRSLQ